MLKRTNPVSRGTRQLGKVFRSGGGVTLVSAAGVAEYYIRVSVEPDFLPDCTPEEAEAIHAELEKISDTVRRMSVGDKREMTTDTSRSQAWERDELAAFRSAVADLTTRVAVLEEGRNAIDDRVRRVMTEVIADWQQQHSDRERKRLEEEVAMLRRSLPGS